jgi:hypothetical protein
MNESVVDLVSDSGKLLKVTGMPASGGRFTVLQFAFASGSLHLSCDDDTDEIIVEIGKEIVDYPNVTHAAIVDLIGMSIEYAWNLTNHRGYKDAFQLRLTNGRGREETLQFEVAASAMDIRRVVA